MTPIVTVIQLVIAIILSAGIFITMITTGLHRTLLCGVAGMAIVIVVWSVYPPAQQLSHSFGFLYWLLVSLVIYHFPEIMHGITAIGGPSSINDDRHAHDDDLLDRFFKESNTK